MMTSLSRRERLLLALGALVVVAVVGWTFLWQPLAESRAALEDRIAAVRSVAVTLDTYPEDGTPRPVAAPDEPVATRVTRSAERAGVPLSRIERQGEGLTALVDEAPFDAVVGWIAEMEREAGLRLVAVELSRRPTPGAVSARLDLSPAR